MVSSGANVIIWCYHVMLSSGMKTHPSFIFLENFTHSALWQIFSVRQPIGRQDTMQTIRISRRLDSFLHEAAQNFELLSNIQDQK